MINFVIQYILIRIVHCDQLPPTHYQFEDNCYKYIFLEVASTSKHAEVC
jgi:hypothetical protein